MFLPTIITLCFYFILLMFLLHIYFIFMYIFCVLELEDPFCKSLDLVKYH